MRRVLAEGAADHTDLGGNHERRVEAHAKLTDDVDIPALVLGVFPLELLAAGMGDGAEVLLEVLSGHADAVVGDGKRARVLVKRDADGKVVVAELNTRVGETLEVELVHRIRRVGDKLTQEDLLVGIDRVDHEVEELLALGFKLLHARNALSAVV